MPTIRIMIRMRKSFNQRRDQETGCFVGLVDRRYPIAVSFRASLLLPATIGRGDADKLGATLLVLFLGSRARPPPCQHGGNIGQQSNILRPDLGSCRCCKAKHTYGGPTDLSLARLR